MRKKYLQDILALILCLWETAKKGGDVGVMMYIRCAWEFDCFIGRAIAPKDSGRDN